MHFPADPRAGGQQVRPGPHIPPSLLRSHNRICREQLEACGVGAGPCRQPGEVRASPAFARLLRRGGPSLLLAFAFVRLIARRARAFLGTRCARDLPRPLRPQLGPVGSAGLQEYLIHVCFLEGHLRGASETSWRRAGAVTCQPCMHRAQSPPARPPDSLDMQSLLYM